MRVPQAIRDRLAAVSPRTRQWALLGGLGLGGVGVLWAIFASTQDPKSTVAKQKRPEDASKVTNVGVMPGGDQVKPLDQWIGIAGRKVDRLEKETEEREKRDRDTEAFKSQVLKRFAELEEKAKQPNTASVPASQPSSPVGVQPSTYPPVATLPPAPGLPGHPPAPAAASAPGGASPAAAAPEAARPQLVRVSLADATKKPAPAASGLRGRPARRASPARASASPRAAPSERATSRQKRQEKVSFSVVIVPRRSVSEPDSS